MFSSVQVTPELLHRASVLEPLHAAGRAADDADQVRADLVLLGLDVVAGLALLEHLLAVLRVGGEHGVAASSAAPSVAIVVET